MIRLLALCVLLVSLFNLSPAQMTLKVGDPAPDFTAPYATKDSIVSEFRLSSAFGSNIIILAFYPADWSGGCTKEMCTMRGNFAKLSELGATVYGISGDYVYSHREWAKFHNLQFALISDHDHSIGKQYESFNAVSGMNLRTIFVIDKKGRIAYVDPAYKAGEPASFEALSAALSLLKIN
jgi:peroxiredoxin